MTIEEIKNQLRKKAVIFKTGGIRPTSEIGESWIGKVGWQLPNETQPQDETGKLMEPIMTLFLEGLDYIPDALKGIKLITIYLSNEFWNNIGGGEYSKWFTIRTYDSLDNLVPCNYISSVINPFPLVPELKTDDFPSWDNVPDTLTSAITTIEDQEGLDYYDVICENIYCEHKIGGNPASIQGGVGYDEGFEFVLEIVSDEKDNFNIVDSGNFYFGYNPQTKTWQVRCDYY